MILIDIETSGTDSRKHSLASIGAIDMLNPERRFSQECQIFKEAHIDPDALKINGFTEDQLRYSSKQTDIELVKQFIDWAMESEDHTIAAHNPMFDVGFIEATSLRGHLNYPLAKRTIDLHSIAYLHMIKAGIVPPLEHHRSALNSDKIHNYCGLPLEPKPHKAINGALFEAESLSRLLYDKKLLPEFSQFSIPWQKTQN
jgi:DNA polymerase III epsilon subunit-like protein